MARYTNADLDERCANVNRRIESTGREVRAQGRNGYVGLDEYTADGSMVRTITAGTKREVAEFLFAMMIGIDLSQVQPPHPRRWIVLADIGTDWPDVFGPYTHHEDAQRAADTLAADHRVSTEIQARFDGDGIAKYLAELDEIIED
jgi:hypothetical protein